MIVTELSKEIKLYLLVGGKGTRLKSITNGVPKPLVDIHGKPFIERVIENLSGFDITLVCSDSNVSYFNDLGYEILNEGSPSGTAGFFLKTNLPDSFYVMNGDTYYSETINVDSTTSTIFVTEEYVNGDEGYIIGSDGRVDKFIEKNLYKSGTKQLVNAGIYKFYRDQIEIPRKLPLSMEYDILTNMDISYKIIETKKFDIGTPERLENFRKWFII